MCEKDCLVCIIHMRQQFEFIYKYMGKLRFTLTYILFWFIIVFSCLLAENFALLSSDHMGGMNGNSLVLLSLFVIFALLFYFFVEHKKNKITFDKILLPIIAIFGLVSIVTIWWQGIRVFDNEWKFLRVAVAFSPEQKFLYSLDVLIWCAVLYGVLFIFNRFSISRKLFKWLPFVYIVGILICSLVDVVIEFDDIVQILTNSSDYAKGGMTFIVYNSNVWGMLLLIGLLSCVVLSLKKFHHFYYFTMIHLFIMIVLSSSSTSTFVGFGVIFLYTLYEVLSTIKTNRKKALIAVVLYVGGVILSFSLVFILSALNVPIAKSFVSFIKNSILFKDYSTLTNRRGIWASVYHLLLESPIDFIFGCGYKTGNIIFSTYYEVIQSGFPARSAHNGLFEVFLRHGVLGLLFYAFAFVPFALGIIKLINKKQYRFAFIYSLCLIGIMGHSLTESTTFFTPNIQGMYLTIVFYLPVANITKDKYFERLKEETVQLPQEETSIDRNKAYYFVETLLMGSIIALAASLLINIRYNDFSILIAYLIGIGWLIIGLFVLPLLLMLKEKMTIKEAIDALIVSPIKHHYIALLATLLVGVLAGLILPLIFSYDLFSYLLFTLFVFVFYNFALQLMDEKNNYLLFSFFNAKFSLLLRNNESEVINE